MARITSRTQVAKAPVAKAPVAKAPGVTKAAASRTAVARKAVPRKATPPSRPARTGPRTLAIDIGGTGLKATVLDPKGAELVERVRVATQYPCPPDAMVEALVALVAPLPAFDRVSVGFPGVVRDGEVLFAPHFVTKSGPGSPTVAKLVTAWDHFPLAQRLSDQLKAPVRLANDADLQGSAIVTKSGVEVVLTLGTGLGSAVFTDGKLSCHLELAHHPMGKGGTYNDLLGDAARKKIGTKKWRKRVTQGVAQIQALIYPDRVHIGGGNSVHLAQKDGTALPELGPKVFLASNEAGLLGGITLWDGPGT